jgi:hypothetical protein
MYLKGYDEWKTTYPKEWDEQEQRADWINERANELVEEWDIFSYDSIVEFLCNSDSSVIKAKFLMAWKQGASMELREDLAEYFYKQAEQIATREVEQNGISDW